MNADTTLRAHVPSLDGRPVPSRRRGLLMRTTWLALGASMVVLVCGSASGAPKIPRGLPGPAPAPPAQLGQASKITVANANGNPGARRTLEATLTRADGAPIAGKAVAFRVEGKNGSTVGAGIGSLGSATTDASGKARLSVALPALSTGNYRLFARFGADGSFRTASDEANLLMLPAPTKLDFGQLIVESEADPTDPGAHPPVTARLAVRLRRATDSRPVARALRVTVNGRVITHGVRSDNPLNTDPFVNVQLPSSAPTWDVRIDFAGDDMYLKTHAAQRYTRPAAVGTRR